MEKMSDKQKRDLLKAHEEDIGNYANDLFVFSQKIRNVKVSLSPERFGKLLEYDNLEPGSWNHSTGEIEWDNGYFFQSAILKVPKKKLEMIIRNFELAIQTNMNNPDINLSGITFELPESFQWWELDTLIQLKFRMNQIQTIYNDICMASGHENIFNHNQLNHSKKLEQSKYNFSVLEWATIFYYADEAKLLPIAKTKKERQETFMSKWKINTTPDNFKNNCIEANNRINKRNNYPIDKLNKIEPFLQEHYSYAVAKMQNDKDFLQNEIDENE